MLFFLVFNTVNFRRHKIFEQRLTKIGRIIQDVSFTIMMAFICVLYFEQKSGNLNPTMKLVVVGSFVILVIINILLEVAMLVKELDDVQVTVACCQVHCSCRTPFSPMLMQVLHHVQMTVL